MPPAFSFHTAGEVRGGPLEGNETLLLYVCCPHTDNLSFMIDTPEEGRVRLFLLSALLRIFSPFALVHPVSLSLVLALGYLP